MELEHTVTHKKVWLRQKIDTALRVAMHEQARHLAQMRADMPGEVPDQKQTMDANSATMKAAVEFWKPLMERWCRDEFKDKSELQETRDKLIKEKGFINHTPKASPRKRPAPTAVTAAEVF